MSVILPQNSSIKPAMWMCDPGTVAYNCARMGLPVPHIAVPMWEQVGDKALSITNSSSLSFHNTPEWRNNGIYLNGIDEGLTFGNNLFNGYTGNFTIAAGIYFSSLADDNDLLFGCGGNPQHVQCEGVSGAKARFKFAVYTTTDYYDPKSSYFAAAEKYYDIVHRYDGSTTKGFSNGVEVATENTAGPLKTGENAFTLGCKWNLDIYFLESVFKYFYFWKCALAVNQIQTLHNNPCGIVEPIRRPPIWSIPSGGVAPTSIFYGPLTGPLSGPI